jgi:two-component system, NarL family, invasion response regulator UvrY
MIRVVIADDHTLVRDGLRRTLTEDPNIAVVGEADSSLTLLELLRTAKADVALIDVSMPGVGFLELLDRMRTTFPQTHAVVVSAYVEREYAVRAFKGGAKAYLDKSRPSRDLIEAVRRAARSATYLTEEQNEWLIGALRGEGESSPAEKLSAREYQVLGLLASGRSAKEVGATMGISVKTVSTYRTRLLEKLNLRTTAELIRFALDNNLRA